MEEATNNTSAGPCPQENAMLSAIAEEDESDVSCENRGFCIDDISSFEAEDRTELDTLINQGLPPRPDWDTLLDINLNQPPSNFPPCPSTPHKSVDLNRRLSYDSPTLSSPPPQFRPNRSLPCDDFDTFSEYSAPTDPDVFNEAFYGPPNMYSQEQFGLENEVFIPYQENARMHDQNNPYIWEALMQEQYLTQYRPPTPETTVSVCPVCSAANIKPKSRIPLPQRMSGMKLPEGELHHMVPHQQKICVKGVTTRTAPPRTSTKKPSLQALTRGDSKYPIKNMSGPIAPATNRAAALRNAAKSGPCKPAAPPPCTGFGSVLKRDICPVPFQKKIRKGPGRAPAVAKLARPPTPKIPPLRTLSQAQVNAIRKCLPPLGATTSRAALFRSAVPRPPANSPEVSQQVRPPMKTSQNLAAPCLPKKQPRQTLSQAQINAAPLGPKRSRGAVPAGTAHRLSASIPRPLYPCAKGQMKPPRIPVKPRKPPAPQTSGFGSASQRQICPPPIKKPVRKTKAPTGSQRSVSQRALSKAPPCPTPTASQPSPIGYDYPIGPEFFEVGPNEFDDYPSFEADESAVRERERILNQPRIDWEEPVELENQILTQQPCMRRQSFEFQTATSPPPVYRNRSLPLVDPCDNPPMFVEDPVLFQPGYDRTTQRRYNPEECGVDENEIFIPFQDPGKWKNRDDRFAFEAMLQEQYLNYSENEFEVANDAEPQAAICEAPTALPVSPCEPPAAPKRKKIGPPKMRSVRPPKKPAAPRPSGFGSSLKRDICPPPMKKPPRKTPLPPIHSRQRFPTIDPSPALPAATPALCEPRAVSKQQLMRPLIPLKKPAAPRPSGFGSSIERDICPPLIERAYMKTPLPPIQSRQGATLLGKTMSRGAIPKQVLKKPSALTKKPSAASQTGRKPDAGWWCQREEFKRKKRAPSKSLRYLQTRPLTGPTDWDDVTFATHPKDPPVFQSGYAQSECKYPPEQFGVEEDEVFVPYHETGNWMNANNPYAWEAMLQEQYLMYDPDNPPETPPPPAHFEYDSPMESPCVPSPAAFEYDSPMASPCSPSGPIQSSVVSPGVQTPQSLQYGSAVSSSYLTPPEPFMYSSHEDEPSSFGFSTTLIEDTSLPRGFFDSYDDFDDDYEVQGAGKAIQKPQPSICLEPKRTAFVPTAPKKFVRKPYKPPDIRPRKPIKSARGTRGFGTSSKRDILPTTKPPCKTPVKKTVSQSVTAPTAASIARARHTLKPAPSVESGFGSSTVRKTSQSRRPCPTKTRATKRTTSRTSVTANQITARDPCPPPASEQIRKTGFGSSTVRKACEPRLPPPSKKIPRVPPPAPFLYDSPMDSPCPPPEPFLYDSPMESNVQVYDSSGLSTCPTPPQPFMYLSPGVAQATSQTSVSSSQSTKRDPCQASVSGQVKKTVSKAVTARSSRTAASAARARKAPAVKPGFGSSTVRKACLPRPPPLSKVKAGTSRTCVALKPVSQSLTAHTAATAARARKEKKIAVVSKPGFGSTAARPFCPPPPPCLPPPSGRRFIGVQQAVQAPQEVQAPQTPCQPSNVYQNVQSPSPRPFGLVDLDDLPSFEADPLPDHPCPPAFDWNQLEFNRDPEGLPPPFQPGYSGSHQYAPQDFGLNENEVFVPLPERWQERLERMPTAFDAMIREQHIDYEPEVAEVEDPHKFTITNVQVFPAPTSPSQPYCGYPDIPSRFLPPAQSAPVSTPHDDISYGSELDEMTPPLDFGETPPPESPTSRAARFLAKARPPRPPRQVCPPERTPPNLIYLPPQIPTPPSGEHGTPDLFRRRRRETPKKYHPSEFGLTEAEKWRHPVMFRGLDFETNRAELEALRTGPQRQVRRLIGWEDDTSQRLAQGKRCRRRRKVADNIGRRLNLSGPDIVPGEDTEIMELPSPEYLPSNRSLPGAETICSPEPQHSPSMLSVKSVMSNLDECSMDLVEDMQATPVRPKRIPQDYLAHFSSPYVPPELSYNIGDESALEFNYSGDIEESLPSPICIADETPPAQMHLDRQMPVIPQDSQRELIFATPPDWQPPTPIQLFSPEMSPQDRVVEHTPPRLPRRHHGHLGPLPPPPPTPPVLVPDLMEHYTPPPLCESQIENESLGFESDWEKETPPRKTRPQDYLADLSSPYLRPEVPYNIDCESEPEFESIISFSDEDELSMQSSVSSISEEPQTASIEMPPHIEPMPMPIIPRDEQGQIIFNYDRYSPIRLESPHYTPPRQQHTPPCPSRRPEGHMAILPPRTPVPSPPTPMLDEESDMEFFSCSECETPVMPTPKRRPQDYLPDLSSPYVRPEIEYNIESESEPEFEDITDEEISEDDESFSLSGLDLSAIFIERVPEQRMPNIERDAQGRIVCATPTEYRPPTPLQVISPSPPRQILQHTPLARPRRHCGHFGILPPVTPTPEPDLMEHYTPPPLCESLIDDEYLEFEAGLENVTPPRKTRPQDYLPDLSSPYIRPEVNIESESEPEFQSFSGSEESLDDYGSFSESDQDLSAIFIERVPDQPMPNFQRDSQGQIICATPQSYRPPTPIPYISPCPICQAHLQTPSPVSRRPFGHLGLLPPRKPLPTPPLHEESSIDFASDLECVTPPPKPPGKTRPQDYLADLSSPYEPYMSSSDIEDESDLDFASFSEEEPSLAPSPIASPVAAIPRRPMIIPRGPSGQPILATPEDYHYSPLQLQTPETPAPPCYVCHHTPPFQRPMTPEPELMQHYTPPSYHESLLYDETSAEFESSLEYESPKRGTPPRRTCPQDYLANLSSPYIAPQRSYVEPIPQPETPQIDPEEECDLDRTPPDYWQHTPLQLISPEPSPPPCHAVFNTPPPCPPITSTPEPEPVYESSHTTYPSEILESVSMISMAQSYEPTPSYASLSTQRSEDLEEYSMPSFDDTQPSSPIPPGALEPFNVSEYLKYPQAYRDETPRIRRPLIHRRGRKLIDELPCTPPPKTPEHSYYTPPILTPHSFHSAVSIELTPPDFRYSPIRFSPDMRPFEDMPNYISFEEQMRGCEEEDYYEEDFDEYDDLRCRT